MDDYKEIFVNGADQVVRSDLDELYRKEGLRM